MVVVEMPGMYSKIGLLNKKKRLANVTKEKLLNELSVQLRQPKCGEVIQVFLQVLLALAVSILYKYHHSTSLLPSVLLRVCSTSNNANGNKRVIFLSGIAGNNDFIIRTFDFTARSDACM